MRSATPPTSWSPSCRTWPERCSRWWRAWRRSRVDVPAGPLVATHRSFRPAQILVDHDDIAFIDFDGFCQSEAGLDLALFRTTLCDLALRALTKDDVPLDAGERRECEVELDELCATFLAGYEEVGRDHRAPARPLGCADQRQGHRRLLAEGQVRAPRTADGVPPSPARHGAGHPARRLMRVSPPGAGRTPCP